MEQFNPIVAADEIKESYIDYITTTFAFSDKAYESELRKQLAQEGFVAKGPYLDATGSYAAGSSLEQLMQQGMASSGFAQLEPVSEKERELKLLRPLYLHQENAMRKANQGQSLVVTTGTGSGKTECFLLPIIHHLLEEKKAGSLGPGVRAILIYPMNALANDQMKRMRKLLKNCPDITFGLYNGNTEHEESEAHDAWRRQYGTEKPLPNELLSREKMQATPPNILITNYSMLEYMMLRPKDDLVFNGVQLRYIVLDEAHIYKGTTGMETAMLMRRVNARLSKQKEVQYILTSATLGSEDENDQILAFAERLTGAAFTADSIVRSQVIVPSMKAKNYYPFEMYADFADHANSVGAILARYGITDPAPDGDDGEKLYELLLSSNEYASLRSLLAEPHTTFYLKQQLNMTEQQFVGLIDACSRAEKNNTSLMKARYHFFVRALEGAYVTLNEPKQLFLQRRKTTDDKKRAVFEAATCTDCGRLAIVGKLDSETGILTQVSRKTDQDPEHCDYFLVQNNDADEHLLEDDDSIDPEDYAICPVCGTAQEGAGEILEPCSECGTPVSSLIRLTRIKRKNGEERPRCPACNHGSLRTFYLGGEAATSVIGTALFEQLPDRIVEAVPQKQASASTGNNRFARFAVQQPAQTSIVKEKQPQFLCFSDSRSEAAFFASYMQQGYAEFLRRRGMWKIASEFVAAGKSVVSVSDFAAELTNLFEQEHTFDYWEASEDRTETNSAASKKNAWIAILNEMFNARRGTSLVSLGVFRFEYQKNDPVEVATALVDEASGITGHDSRELEELLVQDGYFSGALIPGITNVRLSEAEREYIFYSPYEKKMMKARSKDETEDRDAKYATSWMMTERKTKEEGAAFYLNSRGMRLMRIMNESASDANATLGGYWDVVLRPQMEYFQFKATDFNIRFLAQPGITDGAPLFRCKKCGRTTFYNVKNMCAYVACDGMIEPYDPRADWEKNHYVRLYRSEKMKPLQIKEHTAQLSKDRMTQYQEAFVKGKINALSCSTTFEMGVDVGSLETVYMRDVPPGPANYVQRAGRAGRAKQSAAFVMTYAKLSSHDFTYYNTPEKMISGSITAPVFSMENEKVIYRHIFAIALSYVFARFVGTDDDIYNGNDRSAMLNDKGYETLVDCLNSKPDVLQDILIRSIPTNLHERLGIIDFSWTDKLIGEDGVLNNAVVRYRTEIDELLKAEATAHRNHDAGTEMALHRMLISERCSPEDRIEYAKLFSGRSLHPRQLIEFLVRNNVLPKYGFPVDTVELNANPSSIANRSLKDLTLARDLQMAIAEYAPCSQIIADGRMYTSRYIRKGGGYRDSTAAWETGKYCKCKKCGEPNYFADTDKRTMVCISCGETLKRGQCAIYKTLEPRDGFIVDASVHDVPMHKPERDFKTEAYYLGDQNSRCIAKYRYNIGGKQITLESTANDSLGVIGDGEYYVCPSCGYADDRVFAKHKTPKGYDCKNNSIGEKNKYRLTHIFRTDVVKLTFHCDEARTSYGIKVMQSVLYALLEGLSRATGIERTDLKGCLHAMHDPVTNKMLCTIILYDGVAGGAGHVRRIVTESGKVLHEVLQAAYDVVSKCTCDPSCYQCLRNYYNQKIHDELDRKEATAFLSSWLGDVTLVPGENEAPVEANSNEPIPEPKNTLQLKTQLARIMRGRNWPDIWNELLSYSQDAAEKERIQGLIDHADLFFGKETPLCDCEFNVDGNEDTSTADYVWEHSQVMIFASDNIDSYQAAENTGWTRFLLSDASLTPETLAELLN